MGGRAGGMHIFWCDYALGRDTREIMREYRGEGDPVWERHVSSEVFVSTPPLMRIESSHYMAAPPVMRLSPVRTHTCPVSSVTNLPPSPVLWQLLLFNRNNPIPHHLSEKPRSPEVEKERVRDSRPSHFYWILSVVILGLFGWYHSRLWRS